MAMAIARCSWAPWPPHFHCRRLQVGNRAAALRLQALGTNKAAVVKLKKKKKKKKVEKASSQEPEHDDSEEGDFTDIVDMAEWMKNKPPGFGIGKEYDTALEEEILEEMDKGSAGAGEKKKKSSEKPGDQTSANPMGRISLKDGKVVEGSGNKSTRTRKPEPQVEGIKVKVTHLPRKKNISKDLRLAYKGVPGLLQIRPNELANNKTREPVCKGSAILTFAKESNALRFMEKFKIRKLLFGKLEKLPTYELHIPKNEKKKTASDTTVEIGDDEAETGMVSIAAPVEDESSLLSMHDASEDRSSNDEVQESVADAIIEDEQDEQDEDCDDEDGDEEEENFETSSLAVGSKLEEFEDSEEEDDDFGDEEELESSGEWVEEEEDEEDGEGDHHDQALEASSDNTHFVEVDVSVPLTAEDLGGDPDEVILSSNARILELDTEISKLRKIVKKNRKKSSVAELEQQILKLREEKIELLEKRVLARIVAAREAFKARREKKKLAAAEEESSKRSGSRLRMDDEKFREVVAKHFSR
ncbi:glutamic acid-rich protein [Selaginella moellendorffii]|uniref:glutamic acid-rich protein n=1 Tax=Selaginella moellendorffii TaxID=88036 RepID=UPI000D1C7A30|nr:glutamic acid-rich protein [Selaginella moellendorffii]|eukprot:XP_024537321.1 glutamic acid-rich protein [Selaginella moellendorffii]